MKRAEDEAFNFSFTWIEGGTEKGWTTHIRPKHSISPEVGAAFDLTGLRQFASCPEFDFDPCYWHFTAYQDRDGWGNAETAHKYFDALPASFSPGVQRLLEAQSILLPYGLSVLPLSSQQLLVNTESALRAKVNVKAKPAPSTLPAQFDVAISFAGTNRPLAEKLATIIQDAGFAVFYDSFYQEELWGKDLVVFFDEIFGKRSRFCVVLVSQEYVDRDWTNHERRSAQARALKEKGTEYILPVRVDDIELPGMPSTVGYVSLSQMSMDNIAQLLIRKLSS